MKKMFSMCLALSMLAVFAACSAQTSAPDSTQEGVVTTQASEAASTTAGESTTGQDTASQGDVTTAQTEGETSQSATAKTSTTQASKSTAKPAQTTTAKPPVKTSGTTAVSTTGSPNATTKPAEEAQSLAKLMELVYTDYESPRLKTAEIKAEDTEYYFGLKDLQFEEALASEPMMSSIAHSVCIVRVADGTDITQLKKDIKDNVNSFKWICVGVEKDQVIVDSVGNTIILIIDSFDPKLIHSNFLQYAK